MKISDFRILSGWIEKYKPTLSKSDSSWDNSYCVRLVIVSLAVNIGKLQSLLSEEASLQRFLHKLKQKNLFNEIEYDKLYPSGSAPARIYGTPKMHKFSSSDSFPKLRPIVSFIGTFNYNLARFLSDLLSSLVPNDYSCKDTFSFVSQIKNANLSKKFLVSYDVTSLFTNIPL